MLHPYLHVLQISQVHALNSGPHWRTPKGHLQPQSKQGSEAGLLQYKKYNRNSNLRNFQPLLSPGLIFRTTPRHLILAFVNTDISRAVIWTNTKTTLVWSKTGLRDKSDHRPSYNNFRITLKRGSRQKGYTIIPKWCHQKTSYLTLWPQQLQKQGLMRASARTHQNPSDFTSTVQILHFANRETTSHKGKDWRSVKHQNSGSSTKKRIGLILWSISNIFLVSCTPTVDFSY